MAESRFTYGINLKRSAPYQWANFNFNSMAVFNGVPIATNEDGLYSLFDSDQDDGSEIDAFFELTTTDFGDSGTKAFRFLILSGKYSEVMKVTLKSDDATTRPYLVRPKSTGLKQSRAERIPCRRDHQGVYWMVRVDNKSGGDFSVDAIDARIFDLGMR